MTIGHKTGGRQAGTPNKATSEARQAMAWLIEGNVEKMSEWLNTVASGILKVDIETGKEEYLLRPNPAKAFDMLMSVVEYSIPKLARIESIETFEDSETSNERTQVFLNLIADYKRMRQEES